uniref:Uncharacterized protein n=1 Tax=Timema genevievae TaxID=629358 RepID=A0A7R9K5N5_TIMGE|nr:unnamed protein product [Timema genevievae]
MRVATLGDQRQRQISKRFRERFQVATTNTLAFISYGGGHTCVRVAACRENNGHLCGFACVILVGDVNTRPKLRPRHRLRIRRSVIRNKLTQQYQTVQTALATDQVNTTLATENFQSRPAVLSGRVDNRFCPTLVHENGVSSKYNRPLLCNMNDDVYKFFSFGVLSWESKHRVVVTFCHLYLHLARSHIFSLLLAAFCRCRAALLCRIDEFWVSHLLLEARLKDPP